MAQPEASVAKAAAAAPMLSIEGLHTAYGSSLILRGVSLQVAAGEALGLLGRNGMGKTTLIRSLMGLVKPVQGRIAWQGQDVSGQAPERMARLGIGYVPEGRGIFPNLSVRENLLMAARPGPQGQRDWTLERVLATFPRLAERLGHGGQQLSGGEQQMLSIGRALMTNPVLLLLDEATEGLAPLVVAEIWRTIATIRATGISTLLVDRNYRAVLAHTDRAVVLEKGEIVMSGASQALDHAELGQRLGV
jgi:branched-chain amino acid transport system ATP-binding protein